jgi:hypothetical protein
MEATRLGSPKSGGTGAVLDRNLRFEISDLQGVVLVRYLRFEI